MVIRCYMDESRGPNRTFALGAAVALGTEWTWISSQWKKCLERKNKQLKHEGRKCISRYHASDCESRLGEFLGWDVPEKNAFVKELISIVRAHHVHLVGFSVDLNDLAEMYPQIHADYLEKASYAILAWLMFSEIVKDARHLHRLPAIKVVYEHGDVSQHMVLVYDRMKVSRPYGNLFDSIEKDTWKVLPLQVADLIAFEAMKDRDNELGETKRARRLSLSALMSSKCSGSRGLHLNRRGLQILAGRSQVATDVANLKQ